jgi:hypothetical protein
MSYDLYFLPTEHCADPARFLERSDETERAATPEDQARKQAIVAALRRADPALDPFVFDHDEIAKSLGISLEEARLSYGHVELNGRGDGHGIQTTVFDDHVSLTVAYWHGGEESQRVFAIVERYSSEIIAASSYRIYDPQLERVVASFGELRADLLKAYAGVLDQVPALGGGSEPTRTKPWWKFW